MKKRYFKEEAFHLFLIFSVFDVLLKLARNFPLSEDLLLPQPAVAALARNNQNINL